MLAQNYAAALAPTRIQKGVTKATVEKPNEEDRSRNLIVFGLPEEADGVSVFEELDQKPPMTNCVRLGKPAQAEHLERESSDSSRPFGVRPSSLRGLT
eukprot:sb/3478843/